MIHIKQNIDLKNYNTFAIEVKADFFVEINSIQDFKDLIAEPVYQTSEKLIIGGGSNLLFLSNFKGIVIKNNLKGIEVVFEDEKEVLVKVAAGEIWHEFVLWCINRDYAGVENLSLIPGCVGASPMQNIGAYGVEIKDVFEELEALSMKSGELKKFDKIACKFSYRESVFKHEFKNQFFITSVSFRLKKSKELNTQYGAINAELQTMSVKQPSIKDVSNAVINIRRSKLPDPLVLGNAGSFFKNPEVSKEIYERLKAENPELVAYPLDNGKFKLAAGWLIERCGLKGYELNGAGVHEKQALVLVNKRNAKGIDVFNLSAHVINTVEKNFSIRLEREVNII